MGHNFPFRIRKDWIVELIILYILILFPCVGFEQKKTAKIRDDEKNDDVQQRVLFADRTIKPDSVLCSKSCFGNFNWDFRKQKESVKMNAKYIAFDYNSTVRHGMKRTQSSWHSKSQHLDKPKLDNSLFGKQVFFFDLKIRCSVSMADIPEALRFKAQLQIRLQVHACLLSINYGWGNILTVLLFVLFKGIWQEKEYSKITDGMWKPDIHVKHSQRFCKSTKRVSSEFVKWTIWSSTSSEHPSEAKLH